MSKRTILITNDDGIDSDGLKRLAECAKKFGDVWIVAPDGQRSAFSHSVNLREPFESREVIDYPVAGVHAYKVTGTPADCVRVGLLNIVKGKVDVVLSGINFGYNSGTDLQYSATAGAAFEGSFQGVHSIALSEGFNGTHETTDKYLESILEKYIDFPVERNRIVNVNFPDCPISECKGVLENAQTSEGFFYTDTYDEEILSDGAVRYHLFGHYDPVSEPGSDIRGILDNYVTVGIVKNVG